MTNPRDSFCSHCGTRHTASDYPRTCAGCGTEIWANPIPVAVLLVPTTVDAGEGLLVIRRAIPPVGVLALPGGFIEAHEAWEVAAARELREEAAVIVDPETVEPFWVASSRPRPDRVLVFATAAPVTAPLPPFTPSRETDERGVVFGPDRIEDVFAFPLHAEAVRRYFRARGVTGPHRYLAA